MSCETLPLRFDDDQWSHFLWAIFFEGFFIFRKKFLGAFLPWNKSRVGWLVGWLVGWSYMIIAEPPRSAKVAGVWG